MHSDSNTRPYIEALAHDALQRFDDIATKASSELRGSAHHGSDVLVYPNPQAEKEVQRQRHAVREAAQQLRTEPAIARVMIIDDNGTQCTWYICRATPITDIGGLASYRSPIGRMASLQVGSDFELPNGTTVVILEQTQFRPSQGPGGWDSTPTLVTAEQIGAITVDSLRAFVGEGEIANILDQVLTQEQTRVGIVDGIRRHVIERMALRDQPVLDQYQDEIFRLPLNSRLLIVGPPGTGKTTTLIRRLGQKLDIHESILSAEERSLIDEVGRDTNALAHSASWMMFTPTKLLKEYVQEAFAHEGIPSSASPAPRVVAAAGGPRYDATLSSDRRRDHSNGIWLTQPHIQVLLRFREPECPVLRPRSTAVARQAAPLSPSAPRRAYESARPETVYGPERAPRL